MANPEHRGYTEEQALARWKELQSAGTESDMRGIVQVPGHKRFKVELSSTDSEQEEEQQREFVRGKRPKREMDVGEVTDFLQGTLGFQDSQPYLRGEVSCRLGILKQYRVKLPESSDNIECACAEGRLPSPQLSVSPLLGFCGKGLGPMGVCGLWV